MEMTLNRAGLLEFKDVNGATVLLLNIDAAYELNADLGLIADKMSVGENFEFELLLRFDEEQYGKPALAKLYEEGRPVCSY